MANVDKCELLDIGQVGVPMEWLDIPCEAFAASVAESAIREAKIQLGRTGVRAHVIAAKVGIELKVCAYMVTTTTDDTTSAADSIRAAKEPPCNP